MEHDDASDIEQEQFEQFNESIPEEDEEDDDILSASHGVSEGEEDETSRFASTLDLNSDLSLSGP